MAFTREDLMKFVKSTGLVIKVIEDDSSDDTEVKILHLAEPVQAVGSNPTPDGKEMKVSGSKVYVAADDVEKMLGGLAEKDGLLVYNGPLHLDVSKPKIRNVNGVSQVVAAPKIWLTATKFNRRGAKLQTDQRNDLSKIMNTFFAGGTVDLAAETVTVAAPEANADAGAKKEEPTVVANKVK